MRFVFLGPPGVGKGTQAEHVGVKKNIPHISSGDLLRDAIKVGSKVGLETKKFIDKGLLVPDDLIVSLVMNELGSNKCSKGFILDGFPRNLSQAGILDSTLSGQGKKIDMVLYFTASENIIIERIAGRRICTSCDMQYHQLYRPPSKEDICDKCGSSLFQRKDDNPDTVSVRLKVYQEQTEGLIEYYKNYKKLVEINCNGEVLEIREKIMDALGSATEGGVG